MTLLYNLEIFIVIFMPLNFFFWNLLFILKCLEIVILFAALINYGVPRNRPQNYVSIMHHNGPVLSVIREKKCYCLYIIQAMSCSDFVSQRLCILRRFYWGKCTSCRSQWPRGLRHMSVAARLLRLWVRIPPGIWMSVCCECCVLSGRGLWDELITHPEES
jgi:hypothetical protein